MLTFIMSEQDVQDKLTALSNKNFVPTGYSSTLGLGNMTRHVNNNNHIQLSKAVNFAVYSASRCLAFSMPHHIAVAYQKGYMLA